MEKDEYRDNDLYGARRRSSVTGRYMDDAWSNESRYHTRPYSDDIHNKDEIIRGIIRRTSDKRTREELENLLEH